MPLSQPTARNLLHLRDIQLRGYERDDGQIDIEARMTDTKTYSWGNPTRRINAGEALHDMWLRITITKDRVITEVEAQMDSTPHAICPGAAPNYQRLVGLTIGRGFIKSAMALLGGIEGCTHLRELLQPIATVALQTMMSVNKHPSAGGPATSPAFDPALINSCYTYNAEGPLIKPHLANAAEAAEAAE